MVLHDVLHITGVLDPLFSESNDAVMQRDGVNVPEPITSTLRPLRHYLGNQR